jgi:hypothetical protein
MRQSVRAGRRHWYRSASIGLSKPFECIASTFASFCRKAGGPSRAYENHSTGGTAKHVDFSQRPQWPQRCSRTSFVMFVKTPRHRRFKINHNQVHAAVEPG